MASFCSQNTAAEKDNVKVVVQHTHGNKLSARTSLDVMYSTRLQNYHNMFHMFYKWTVTVRGYRVGGNG